MRNKTVNVTYQRKNVKGFFGKTKPKLVRVKKTVTKTSARGGKSDLDIIAGMKGKEQGKALRSRQINRTLQSLELGSSTLGGMSSIGKNVANAISYRPTTTPTNNTANQNINGGIQTSQDGRDEDEESTEGRGVA